MNQPVKPKDSEWADAQAAIAEAHANAAEIAARYGTRQGDLTTRRHAIAAEQAEMEAGEAAAWTAIGDDAPAQRAAIRAELAADRARAVARFPARDSGAINQTIQDAIDANIPTN